MKNCERLFDRAQARKELSYVISCRWLLRAHTIQCLLWLHLLAWRRLGCPSIIGVVDSFTMFRRNCIFMLSIGDQAGVMQLGFFFSARYCKATVFAQEGVRDLWQECCCMFMDFSYTVPLQRRTSGITRLSPYVYPYLRILPLNAICFDSERDIMDTCVEYPLKWLLRVFVIYLRF
ncbi:Hypothetical_protein [Hexamita inflata]|uniref:Hypothetical_protein n=1 Tax=Hexamita inflata TaxID=28002 RepID=A0AA86UH43_9EUKA|nr:Hypothetical protein HINF_LOCUS37156 [Hexamita inflata]CAI9950907.1 Hypothetical protein HINF_LOCUS38552 [Hexamita inflata]